jgi:5-methylcytosine-specific restriction endonuclease McrA
MRARTVCSVPGCPRPAVTRGQCEQHRRVVGRRWQLLKATVLDEYDGRCARCGRPAVQVHHVRAVAGGGRSLPPRAELEPLCDDCHAAESPFVPITRR